MRKSVLKALTGSLSGKNTSKRLIIWLHFLAHNNISFYASYFILTFSFSYGSSSWNGISFTNRYMLAVQKGHSSRGTLKDLLLVTWSVLKWISLSFFSIFQSNGHFFQDTLTSQSKFLSFPYLKKKKTMKLVLHGFHNHSFMVIGKTWLAKNVLKFKSIKTSSSTYVQIILFFLITLRLVW